jgi:hypothetical protein
VKVDLDVADSSAPRQRCHFHEPQYHYAIYPVIALERSRLRGGRFACNTRGVMPYFRTPISIELPLVELTPWHMIEIP